MKPISDTSPLHPGGQGAEVANLQEGLTLLLNRQVIQTDPALRQTLLNLLSNEAHAQVYKDGTAKTVSIFQQQRHLQPSGTVDAPTAEALNASLKDLGAFDTARDGQKRVVAGLVVQDDRAPFKGTVILFQDGGQGSIHLGQDAADPEGRYSIGYDSALGLNGAHLHVVAFDPNGQQRADATIEAPKAAIVANAAIGMVVVAQIAEVPVVGPWVAAGVTGLGLGVGVGTVLAQEFIPDSVHRAVGKTVVENVFGSSTGDIEIVEKVEIFGWRPFAP